MVEIYPMTRLLDKWIEGFEEGWSLSILLAIFVTCWTGFLVIGYQSADLHPDVIEAWTIGRALDWGNGKHPPLTGWIVHCWSVFFPVTDWSFYLLAMMNAAAALWTIDLITRQFVRHDKRVIALLLLLLLPVYQFQAQKFNANSVLFAVWPIAIYCFARSYETRLPIWAFFAGVVGALAVLGKYYSAFLIFGFVFGAICHPNRQAYFRSSAPWISVIVGVAILSPHFYHLARMDTGPLDYAAAAHGTESRWRSVLSGFGFLVGVAATLTLPLLVWATIIPSKWGMFFGSFRNLNPRLLLLLLIGIGAIVSPPIAGIFLRTAVTSVWAGPGLFIFVIVSVCGSQFEIERQATRRLAGGILGFTILAVIVAPIYAVYRNSHPSPEGRNYFRLATIELMKRWRQTTSQQLENASGDKLGMAIGFYSLDHPTFIAPATQKLNWHRPSEEVLRKGLAAMCFQDEPACLGWSKDIAGISPGAQIFDFDILPTVWGIPGVVTRISALIVPPADEKK